MKIKENKKAPLIKLFGTKNTKFGEPFSALIASVVKSLINEYGFLLAQTYLLIPLVSSINKDLLLLIYFSSDNIVATISLIVPS